MIILIRILNKQSFALNEFDVKINYFDLHTTYYTYDNLMWILIEMIQINAHNNYN